MIENGIKKVLIVGGGVGGMALAILFRRRGLEVDLVDIDPDWRAVGAGLTLNGATLRAFEILGILDEVKEAGHIHGGRRTHRSDGELIRETPSYVPVPGDLKAGGGILRPALHAILSRHVLRLRTQVWLGLTVARLDQHDDKVDVQFSDGTTGAYDLVVGADGIMSKVRQLIMPDVGRPEFTGQGCWRAVFDRPAEIATTWVFVDPYHKVGLNPVSSEKMYMFMLESAPGNPWREESGWIETLREKMRGYGGAVRTIADQLGPDSMVNYRPLETMILPTPWHRGRIALIGDAAHAMTPHAGYGAGLAIEDSIVLDDSLGAEQNVETGLTAYCNRRYPRCADVLARSLALGRMEMKGAPTDRQLAASDDLFALTWNPF